MNDHARLVNRHSVDQLAEIRARIKDLQTEEKQIAAEVSTMMGDRDSLGGNEWIAKQTISNRKGAIDPDALSAAGIDPDQYRKPETTVFAIRVERRVSEVA